LRTWISGNFAELQVLAAVLSMTLYRRRFLLKPKMVKERKCRVVEANGFKRVEQPDGLFWAHGRFPIDLDWCQYYHCNNESEYRLRLRTADDADDADKKLAVIYPRTSAQSAAEFLCESIKDRAAMLHEDITREIIGSAIVVLNALKPGLNEKIYENALVIELRTRGIKVEQQRRFPIHYRGRLVGRLIPDLIVNEKVIVDPKVVTSFSETHTAQMIGYLKITGLQVALLLNFKEFRLDWKRVVNERTSSSKPAE
jgi:GxxExxY protein